MTEKELSELYSLERQIKRIKWRIKELKYEEGVGAVNYDGMPHSKTPGNPTEQIAIRKAELLEKLTSMLEDKITKETEIRDYIETIEDEEIKDIADMRFICCMNWFDIAAELSIQKEKDIDRTTVAKKLRRYIKKRHEIEKNIE